jgi:hypothetical protein
MNSHKLTSNSSHTDVFAGSSKSVASPGTGSKTNPFLLVSFQRNAMLDRRCRALRCARAPAPGASPQ